MVRRSITREVETVKRLLNGRSIVLIGLMGAGKSSVGRRLAQKLGMPFVDADAEIEMAAGKSITDIFADHGEAYFRDGERKVIARLLGSGPQVLATGGGAFMNAETREKIAACSVSVWLKADLPLLMKRVRRRDDRPLLKTDEPETKMKKLMAERYPVYATATITVESRDVPHTRIVADVIRAISVQARTGSQSSSL